MQNSNCSFGLFVLSSLLLSLTFPLLVSFLLSQLSVGVDLSKFGNVGDSLFSEDNSGDGDGSADSDLSSSRSIDGVVDQSLLGLTSVSKLFLESSEK